MIAGKMLEKDEYAWGFDAQTGEFKDLVAGRHHRPDQGRAHRAAGRRFGRRPARHHRGDGRREAGEEGPADASGRRHGRHGRHGFLGHLGRASGPQP